MGSTGLMRLSEQAQEAIDLFLEYRRVMKKVEAWCKKQPREQDDEPFRFYADAGIKHLRETASTALVEEYERAFEQRLGV